MSGRPPPPTWLPGKKDLVVATDLTTRRWELGRGGDEMGVKGGEMRRREKGRK